MQNSGSEQIGTEYDATAPRLTNLGIRQFYAQKNLPLNGHGIEFGAYDRPLFAPGEYDVSYADHYSTEELRGFAQRDAAHNSSIVDVKYVVKDADFAKSIPCEFDFLIASHVIEHIPDIINWFDNASKILNKNGRVFLVVPDKRYTFDYCRHLSTLGTVLGNHFEKRVAPRFEAVFDNLYLFRSCDADQLWAGTQDPHSLPKRFDVNTALTIAKDFWSRNDASIHSHVFTYDSFMEILEQLREANLLKFRVIASYDVYRPYNEFYVVLEKL